MRRLRPSSDRGRGRRDLHLLDEHGMVACNPRDREAAHRAAVEGIATDRQELVTCPRCAKIARRMAKARIEDASRPS